VKKINRVAFQGNRRAQYRKPDRKGGNIIPGVHSLDPKTIRFKFELAKQATETFPASESKPGIAGSNGVPRDFSALTTVMPGYPMDPTPVPLGDNRQARVDAKLPEDPQLSARHRAIFTELFDLMFGEVDFSRKLHLRRDASLMMPLFLHQINQKMEYLNFILRNARKILEMLAKGRLWDLAREFGVMACSMVVYRDQQDGCVLGDSKIEETKGREAADEEYARSAGKHGSRPFASKIVEIAGRVISMAQAARRRVAYGVAGALNFLASCLFTPLRGYQSKFEFTFKHRTREHKLAKMQQFKYHVGIDVHQHDQMIAPEIVDLFIELCHERFHPLAALLIGVLMRAPVYVPPPSQKHTDGFWIGNPFDPKDFRLMAGLLSGLGFNPDFGKWNMVGTNLCTVDDIRGDTLEEGLETILRGEGSWAMLNMTDDGVFCLNELSLYNTLIEKIDDGTASPYHRYDIETPIVFLGDVYFERASGLLTMAPNPVSYYTNFWANEYPVESRPLWYLGFAARQIHYSTMDIYGDLFELQNKLFRDHFGTSLNSVVQAARAEAMHSKSGRHIASRLNSGLMTEADKQYLISPDVIYYKVDPDDLSDEIRDHAVRSVEGAEIEKHLGWAYK
jgi:hypothetical protein